MVTHKRNFRLQLAAAHEPQRIDLAMGRVNVTSKTVVVRSSSIKGAYQKLRRYFSDVKQFQLVN
jgi:hypothetical protein